MDLLAILAASAALIPAVIFTTGTVRIVLGLVFLLFSPGYTLIAALFPRKGSLGEVERVALSFGMSIAVVPLIGLILNYTPWGIRLYPILTSVALFILAMCAVAWRRRRGLEEKDRFQVNFKIRWPSWWGQSTLDKTLSLLLILSIVGALGTLVYVVATPKVGEKFTEFYVLGDSGRAAGYPTSLSMGKKGEVILGIVNHEQEETDYQVKVLVDGVKGGVKLWLAEDDGEANLVADNVIDITGIADGEKWERHLQFEPQQKGEGQELKFLLFKGGESVLQDSEAYLSLHLWVDVG